jgi:hypothetical protein
VEDLLEPVCKANSLDKPFLNEAQGRSEEKSAAQAIQYTLCHNDLYWLGNINRLPQVYHVVPLVCGRWLTVLEKAAPMLEATMTTIPSHINNFRLWGRPLR